MGRSRDAAKCNARGGMTRDEVKSAVRERDGFKCTKCGMTDAAHREQTGRALQVHRISPGAMYTVSGCVLLCARCHGSEPKRSAGTQDEDGYPCFMVRLPESHRAALEVLRKKHRRAFTEEVQIALERHYKEEGVEFPPNAAAAKPRSEL